LCGSGAHAFFLPERKILFFVPWLVNPDCERQPDAQNGLGQEEITPKHHTLAGWLVCVVLLHIV
jgi:hypothetical protein